MATERVLAGAAATAGACAGVCGAVLGGLASGPQSDAILSFVGSIGGAGIGAALPVVAAIFIAGAEKRRAWEREVEEALRQLRSLDNAVGELKNSSPYDVDDAFLEVVRAVGRVQARLGDPDLTDVPLRKALADALKQWDRLSQEFEDCVATFQQAGNGADDTDLVVVCTSMQIELERLKAGYRRKRL